MPIVQFSAVCCTYHGLLQCGFHKFESVSGGVDVSSQANTIDGECWLHREKGPVLWLLLVHAKAE